jgi:hypothetical protein
MSSAPPLKQSPVAFLMPQIMRRDRRGNVVELITKTKQGADKDLGVKGTVTETPTMIEPEPFLNAIGVDMVQRSGGVFRFSDLRMTMARESIQDTIALDAHTEFNVNGVRVQILGVTPGPSAWEFIIRRKASEPVTP